MQICTAGGGCFLWSFFLNPGSHLVCPKCCCSLGECCSIQASDCGQVRIWAQPEPRESEIRKLGKLLVTNTQFQRGNPKMGHRLFLQGPCTNTTIRRPVRRKNAVGFVGCFVAPTKRRRGQRGLACAELVKHRT